MEIIIFSITLIFTTLFLIVKFLEVQKNKSFITANYLSKSDKFLLDVLNRFRLGCDSFYNKTNDVPGYTITMLGWVIRQIVKTKNFIVSKIVKIFRLHNVKDIKRDRGSTSVFLKNISKDSETLKNKEED